MPALPPAGRKLPPRIKLRTRHGPGADTGWGRERKKRYFNLALITSVAVDKRPERTGQETQVPGPTGLAGPALPQVFTLDRLSAGRLVGWGHSSNGQGQLPLLQEPSWKCPFHIWACEHERKEEAQCPQIPGLGCCQRLHLIQVQS